MNVLLLNLSTFPKNRQKKNELRRSEFFFNHDTGKIEVEGYYQLEPIPNLMEKMGIVFDEVVLLATKETRDIVEVSKVRDAENSTNVPETSPEDYFVEFMLSGNKMQESCRSKEHCLTVEIDSDMPAEAIQKTAKRIQNWAIAENVDLYVDTHGGFRGTQLVVEAVMNLLIRDSSTNEVVTHYYTVKYSNEPGQKSQIVEDSTVRIFDFVSGINEFLNYGRIDSLERYLPNEDNALLGPIREIAEGIQWCDISSFELGITHLKAYMNNVSSNVNNAYLRLFLDRIRNDYGKILEGSYPDARITIEWCMRKGFYQQALTLIEARIVRSLFDRHIMALTTAGETFRNQYKVYASQVHASDTDILNGCMKSYYPETKWWNNNGKFNQLFRNSSWSNDKRTEEIVKFMCSKVSGEYKNGANYIAYDKVIKTVEKCSLIVYQEGEKSCNQAVTLSHNGTPYSTVADKKKLMVLLFLHKTLKDVRNKLNHALDDNSYSQTAVKNAVMYYMWLVDSLKRE